MSYPVNIIVPVYRNLAVTRRCLESVLASVLPPDTSITVIDDASPEHELSHYCQALADEGRIILLVNEENRGFVVAANRGFDANPDVDVLLLNSDTEVAGDWLQRLQSCAYRDEETGTVTPFSNNGTICSYPIFASSSPLPEQWNTAELDQLFRSGNALRSMQIPTAVGFCMYIKKRCLEEVGGFDEESFGLGYGEECDFSMRAANKGWNSAIAADVFVFHEGAVSFAGKSDERKEKADLVMQSLHPQYDEQVTRFILEDPLAPYRRKINSLRLIQKPEDAVSIMAELGESRTVLRDILRAERDARKAQEALFAKALEKNVWLEKELEKQLELCSRQEQELAALQERERHYKLENETLGNLLNQTRDEFSRTDTALSQVQQELTQSNQLQAQMREEISQIKQSRSWRYTAWIRRVTGSL